jgi:DNA-binding transcriptional MerR regulator
LITARRTTNGYREYEDVLSRLDLIDASKELDLPLQTIAWHLLCCKRSRAGVPPPAPGAASKSRASWHGADRQHAVVIRHLG